VSVVKLIFAGTPEAAVPTLEALISSDFEVVAVLTRPDAPQGRKEFDALPVVQLALGDIPAIYANRIDDEIQATIDSFKADLGVAVAHGALPPRNHFDLTEARLDQPTFFLLCPPGEGNTCPVAASFWRSNGRFFCFQTRCWNR
jgi:hypothetical protein